MYISSLNFKCMSSLITFSADHFCFLYVQMLSDLGCITKHTIYRNKPTTLFTAPMQQDTSKPTNYYQPTVDGLVRLAECYIMTKT